MPCRPPFHRLFGVVAICLLAPLPADAEPTRIYGPGGADWNRQGGPLPDFSYAGYQRGEKPLPERAAEVSVGDYGAAGDGIADDTSAIQRAIDENPGKVILLPEGRYLISDVITIRESGTVLQGEGPEKTYLYAPTPLQEIHPRPIQYPATGGTSYAYSGGFLHVIGSSGHFAGDSQPVAAPARRGATVVELAPGHGFEPGDEIGIVATEDAGQTLLRHLYRDDPGDISAAGDSRSFRHFTRVAAVDGGRLTLERPLPIDLRSEWRPEARRFQPRIEEVGIEHLAIEFPRQPYLGHFTEAGHNAIHIHGAVHSWVRNVRILNADSGIFLGGGSVFCTIDGVVVESSRRTSNPLDAHGHHAISLTGADCLCTNFDIQARFIHDLTVSGGSTGNVFSNGRGLDLALDHHKRGPYENLFSNLDLGRGSRVFRSGGAASVGRHAGAGNTYWNLVSRNSVEVPEGFAPDRMNIIGLRMRGRNSEDPDGRWVETIRPGTVDPPDLHAAQLERRLGGADAGARAEQDSRHEWTNARGITIEAGFGGIEGDEVILVLPDGRRLPYPAKDLSEDSRALARELARTLPPR